MASLVIDNKELGRRIAIARKAAGWSQEAVAEVLHMHPMSVSKWERGVARPTLHNLARIASLFDVDIEDLIDPAIVKSIGVAEFDAAAEEREPEIPPAVREWIARFLTAMDRAGVETFEVERARQRLSSPDLYSFGVAGMNADSDQAWLDEAKEFVQRLRKQYAARGIEIEEV